MTSAWGESQTEYEQSGGVAQTSIFPEEQMVGLLFYREYGDEPAALTMDQTLALIKDLGEKLNILASPVPRTED